MRAAVRWRDYEPGAASVQARGSAQDGEGIGGAARKAGRAARLHQRTDGSVVEMAYDQKDQLVRVTDPL
ncbi:hypothetical protein DEE83_30360, partial [Burkholderia contaminans]|uniref:hypothetical protein n=1 Tax=Burkholderia contaminans TaxID=488447 RepID=UPI001C71EA9F